MRFDEGRPGANYGKRKRVSPDSHLLPQCWAGRGGLLGWRLLLCLAGRPPARLGSQSLFLPGRDAVQVDEVPAGGGLPGDQHRGLGGAHRTRATSIHFSAFLHHKLSAIF